MIESNATSALFRNRHDAGRKLAARLGAYANRPDLIVLALPRGGVPVAFEVAWELDAPLDLFLVRKLGVPGHEELAMGAIATGGVRVLNEEVVEAWGIPDTVIEAVAATEECELARRERLYRGARPGPNVLGQTVILVDDGLATGSTMRAAAEAIRLAGPARIVAAVPVAAAVICAAFGADVDETVCAETPEPFYAVGLWYEDFAPTSDEEVRELLRRAEERTPGVQAAVGQRGEPGTGATALTETLPRLTVPRAGDAVDGNCPLDLIAARMPDQLDAMPHLAETHALEPLERTSGWAPGKTGETYPGAE